MCTSIRICKNIYEDKSKSKYTVRINQNNQVYTRSFCYIKDGKKTALLRAIKFKKHIQQKLGITRETHIVIPNRQQKTKWQVYLDTIKNTIQVSLCFNNVIYRKSFAFGKTRTFETALLNAKLFKNNLTLSFNCL